MREGRGVADEARLVGVLRGAGGGDAPPFQLRELHGELPDAAGGAQAEDAAAGGAGQAVHRLRRERVRERGPGG